MKDRNSPDISFIEQVAERFGQVYFSFDTSTKTFRHISPGFEQVLGISSESIKASPHSFVNYVHEEDIDFLAHKYTSLLLSHEEEQVEFRVVLGNQEVRWLCVSAVMVQEGDQQLIAGLAEDITEYKEYIRNIMKYNNKKNSTLEILSHDLAAPFANIQGMINAIEEQIQAGEADIQQLLNFIKQDALRGSDMIRDFVDHEFLESSQVVLHKERVDLCNKLAIMMDNYRERQSRLAKS